MAVVSSSLIRSFANSRYRTRYLSQITRRQIAGLVAIVIFTATPAIAQDKASQDETFSGTEILKNQPTSVLYSIRIDGSISTPNEQGTQTFPLTSTGEFQFRNQQIETDQTGIVGLRAQRTFRKAETRTVVDKNQETLVSLPSAYGQIHSSGHQSQFVSWHPKFALLRKQSDLLRMPFDPLVVQALFTSTEVKQSDSWNAAAWVVPALTGLDATVTQTVTCRLTSLTSTEAKIQLEGSIEGAVTGSASHVNFAGAMSVDRQTGIISQANITMKEKRTAGPVSPGIDVTAVIQWAQDPIAGDAKSDPVAAPNDRQLLLSAKAPGNLRFRHSREWHLFHETPSVMMLRLLRNGRLIGQANFSQAATVKPGTHTPDEEFDADIRDSVNERKGKILKNETVSDQNGWRLRHVQATGTAGEKTILWDYFLCTAKSGQQFSVVFSHATEDTSEFENEPLNLLSMITLPQRRRPAIPFR